MAKTDLVYYIGVKYAEGVSGDDAKEEKAYNTICHLAEKWGQMSMGTDEHTKGSNLEFGFPVANT